MLQATREGLLARNVTRISAGASCTQQRSCTRITTHGPSVVERPLLSATSELESVVDTRVTIGRGMASTKMMTVFTTEQTKALVGVLMLTSKLAFVVIAFTRSGLLRSKDFPGII